MRNIEKFSEKIMVNKGIYNNIDIMENTKESISNALNKNYLIHTQVNYLSDGEYIVLDELALEKLFNIKDSIDNYIYSDLEYISPFKILKLDELLSILKDNNTIIYIKEYKTKQLKTIIKKLEANKDNLIIESDNLKTIKSFKKSGFKTCLKIDKHNKSKINSFFKPEVYNIELHLLEPKQIKKLREHSYVITTISNLKQMDLVKNSYDNFVLDITML